MTVEGLLYGLAYCHLGVIVAYYNPVLQALSLPQSVYPGNMAETIAARIRRLRIARKMSPADLAAELRITENAVRKWESGDSKRPSLTNAVALGEIFDCSPAYVLYGKERPLRVVRSPQDRLEKLEAQVHPLVDGFRELCQQVPNLEADQALLNTRLAQLASDVRRLLDAQRRDGTQES